MQRTPRINGRAVSLDYWRETRARNQFRTTTVKRGRSTITVRAGADIELSKTAISGLDDPNVRRPAAMTPAALTPPEFPSVPASPDESDAIRPGLSPRP